MPTPTELVVGQVTSPKASITGEHRLTRGEATDVPLRDGDIPQHNLGRSYPVSRARRSGDGGGSCRGPP